MDWTVITCFHNSQHRLNPYFEALRALVLDGLMVEFVFVDNASTDSTNDRLASEAARLSAPSRVLRESRPGLMFARCTGVAAARGRWTLFLDDDNEPRPDYLQELSRLSRKFPEAAMFTGNCVLPQEYQVPPGSEEVLGLIVIRRLSGEFAFDYSEFTLPHQPWGAGLCAETAELRVSCDAWMGTDQKVTGRTGSKLSGGEDIWLAHFLTRNRQPAVFSDRLELVHRVDLHRLQTHYLTRLAFENGVEFLTCLEAVKQLKPAVATAAPSAARRRLAAVAILPLRLLMFLLAPTPRNATAAAGTLGLVYSYLLRWVAR